MPAQVRHSLKMVSPFLAGWGPESSGACCTIGTITPAVVKDITFNHSRLLASMPVAAEAFFCQDTVRIARA
jgi:hypothetical protein